MQRKSLSGLDLHFIVNDLQLLIRGKVDAIYQDVAKANQRMLGASGQQIALAQSHINISRANEIKLAEASEKLYIANQLIEEDKAAITLFSKELEATKALLSQTETMLIQVNDRSVDVNNQLQALKTQGPSQTALLAGAQSVMSVAGAKALITNYREQINSIKGEMKRLKKEELAAREMSMIQIDEQKLLLGNNGYFVKDGESIEVDVDRYQSLTADQSGVSGNSQINNDVEINVTFFE